ncbi:MAG: hypothetical protein N2688_08070, partial [Burkholderiaceae bacterium]|nr:hypothetical protein [Burkholderiaceae bacterium]
MNPRRRALLALLPALPGVAGAQEPDFAFAVLGDTPYSAAEEAALAALLAVINADQTLRFAVHVGDLKASDERCDDRLLAQRLALLDRLALPWLFTPGDNDWADCHDGAAGRFHPLERLQRLRALAYPRPDRSRGPRPLALVHQPAPFVENARFDVEGVVCATVHVIGSDNGWLPWRGLDLDDRTIAPRADRVAEIRAREAAALAWIDQAFDHAQASGARGLALFFHANPHLGRSAEHPRRRRYHAIVERIRARAAAFARPVLLAHGALHWSFVARPFPDLPLLTRVQVPGSPF